MKVCFTTYRGSMYSGGQGIYAYYLTRSLARLGHEVHLIAGPPYPKEPEGVTLHKIPNANFFEKGSEAMMDLNIKQVLHPLNVYEWAASRFGNLPEILGFSLRAVRAIPKLHEKVGFDVIHDNQCLGYGFLATGLLDIPQVVTIHHPLDIDREKSIGESETLIGKISNVFYYPMVMQKISLRVFKRVITVSEASAKDIRNRFGVQEKDIRVIYNGIDETLFDDPSKRNNGLGRETDDPQEITCKSLPGVKEETKFLFVGDTEHSHKGFRVLARALRHLDRWGVEARLRVINGNTPDSERAKELIQKLGFEDRVEFLGKLSVLELIEEYASATAVVLPSLHEGFGFPAIEAMSCGSPVIATTAGALPEIVSEEAGILVPPGKDMELAEAMRYIHENLAERKIMAKKARELVESRFTWEEAAKDVVEVYREVVDAC